MRTAPTTFGSSTLAPSTRNSRSNSAGLVASALHPLDGRVPAAGGSEGSDLGPECVSRLGSPRASRPGAWPSCSARPVVRGHRGAQPRARLRRETEAEAVLGQSPENRDAASGATPFAVLRASHGPCRASSSPRRARSGPSRSSRRARKPSPSAAGNRGRWQALTTRSAAPSPGTEAARRRRPSSKLSLVRRCSRPQAHCASPWPKDQFSFLTSTRLMRTSSGLRPAFRTRVSATAR